MSLSHARGHFNASDERARIASEDITSTDEWSYLSPLHGMESTQVSASWLVALDVSRPEGWIHLILVLVEVASWDS